MTSYRIGFRAVLLAVVLSMASSVMGEERAHQFDIPALDAPTSLDILAGEVGYSLLYQPEDLDAVDLKALQGSYLLPDALEILLKGTHLSATVTKSGVIVIKNTPIKNTLKIRWEI